MNNFAISKNWRKSFIELAEAIYRELGFDPPVMLYDDGLPLIMELELDGGLFELHHSNTNLSNQILVLCKLDAIPDSDRYSGFENILCENLRKIRTHAEWYGIDSNNNLIIMSRKEIDQISVSDLIHDMKQMLVDSINWKERFFVAKNNNKKDLSNSNSAVLA